MVTGGYRVLEEDTTDYNRLQGVTRGFRMFQGITRAYIGLHGEVTRDCKRLQGVQAVTQDYKRLQEVTGSYKG